MMKHAVRYIGFVLFLTGCVSPQYLPRPSEFKYHLNGLVLKGKLYDGSVFLGEMIEVAPQSVLLLSVDLKSGERLMTYSKEEIQSAEIIVCTTSDRANEISTWAILLNWASLGHGYYAVVTLPINLAFTLAIALDATKGTYRIKYPNCISWSEMAKFSRFPQGLPGNLDPKDLK